MVEPSRIERLGALLPRPRSWRVTVPLLFALALLFALGGVVGRVAAICLLPRLMRPLEGDPLRPTPLRDGILALTCGVALAVLCGQFLGPALIAGGTSYGSDASEHLCLLQIMENPGWPNWPPGRYPLPALLVRPLGWAGDVHDMWLLAAALSVGALGAGLYLWGRAVAGTAAGLCAALLVGSVPDLAILARTVNAYPEITALWTLGAGLAAYALRFPHPVTLVLAGCGAAGVFSSDARGLVPGVPVFFVAVIAALAARGGWRRRGLGLALVLLPVLGSWGLHRASPIHLFSLEERIAILVRASQERTQGPSREPWVEVDGWVWGRSGPLQVPRSAIDLLGLTSRIELGGGSEGDHQVKLARHVTPLLAPLGLLAAAGVLLRCGAPPWRYRRRRRAWWDWLDLRGWVALAPVVAQVPLMSKIVTTEYTLRFAVLAYPGFLVLAGVGVAALAGRRAAPALPAMAAAALVFALPGPLSVRAEWRPPVDTPHEIVTCLEAAQTGQRDFGWMDVDLCIECLAGPPPGWIASPFVEAVALPEHEPPPVPEEGAHDFREEATGRPPAAPPSPRRRRSVRRASPSATIRRASRCATP